MRNTDPLRHDDATELVDAATAASLLGVKQQTLYSYVSRGLIRTAPKHGSKKSMYVLKDLDIVRLKGRRIAPQAVPVEQSLRIGGSAVLHTSITAITAEGPVYRGRKAVDLVRQGVAFEDCIELLWTGVMPMQRIPWRPLSPDRLFIAFTEAISKAATNNSPRRLMGLTIEAYAACVGKNAEQTLGAPTLAARELIQVVSPVFGLLSTPPRYQFGEKHESIAGTVARNCNLDASSEIISAIDSSLILAADHELAPSTFAARIAASTGADIFACVNCALGAFEGVLTGMGCDEAERSLLAARSPKQFVASVMQKRSHKETASGFGQPLYPAGDPRAVVLMELARTLAGRDPTVNKILACVNSVKEETGEHPNLAMALVAISSALHMPRQSASGLMAMGRTAGWIAHVFEQRLAGFLVRPRAKYIGPRPS